MMILPLLFATLSARATAPSPNLTDVKRKAAQTRLYALEALVRSAGSVEESNHRLYRARVELHGWLELVIETWPKDQGHKGTFRRILESFETPHFVPPSEDPDISLQNHHVLTILRLVDDLAGFLKIRSSWRFTDDGRLIRELRDSLVAGVGGVTPEDLDGLLGRIENAAVRTDEERAKYVREIGARIVDARNKNSAVERRNAFAAALARYFELETLIHGVNDAACASKLTEPPTPPLG